MLDVIGTLLGNSGIGPILSQVSQPIFFGADWLAVTEFSHFDESCVTAGAALHFGAAPAYGKLVRLHFLGLHSGKYA
jgi:hypothetical protein